MNSINVICIVEIPRKSVIVPQFFVSFKSDLRSGQMFDMLNWHSSTGAVGDF